jgi:hypothetical protein
MCRLVIIECQAETAKAEERICEEVSASELGV